MPLSQAQRGQRLVGVYLAKLIGVGAVYLRSHVVGVFDGVRVLVDVALTAVQVLLQRRRSFEPMLENMLVTISVTPTLSWSPSLRLPRVAACPVAAPSIMEVMSKPVLWICSGYSDSVSSSTD